MIRFLAVFVCLLALLQPVSAFAATCDSTYPWYYDVRYTCDRTNTDGPCRLSEPVVVSIGSWGSTDPSCATVDWSFGDGTVRSANGATPIAHQYAAAGTYTVRALVRTATYPSGYPYQFTVAVANGKLRWNSQEVVEGNTATFRVTRANPVGATQLQWRIVGPGGTVPTDVSPVSGTVSLADGVTVAAFDVAALNDTAFRGRRGYNVEGVSATGGFIRPDSVTLGIEDDDAPVLDFATREFRTIERDGVVAITVNRIAGDPNIRVTTGYSVSEAPTIRGTSGTLVFEPGVMSRTFNVVTVNDNVWSGTQRTSISISSPTGGARYANGSFYSHGASLIVEEDDELPTITVADVSVVEGDQGITRGSFVLETRQPMFVSVFYSITPRTAVPGVDYRAVPSSGVLTFSPGQPVHIVPFDVIGDKQTEGDETFQLSLHPLVASTVRVPPPATATIVNDDAGLGPTSFYLARGAKASAYLNLGVPAAAPVVVSLQSSNPGVVSVPASLTIPAGAASAEIVLTAVAPGLATVDAQLPASYGSKVLTTRVHVYEPMGLTFDPAAVKLVAGQRVPVRVKLDRAPERPVDLPLVVLNTRVARTPATVSVGPDGTGTFLLEGVAAGVTVVRATLPGEYGSDVVSLDVHVTPAADSPSLASLSPATGPTAGGTAFTATGSKLTSACTLSFGGSPATAIKANGDGTIRGITPLHAAGTTDVTLTCGAAQFVLERAFTYVDVAPELSSVTPAFGTTRGKTLVQASGANFRSGCWMFFGDVPAERVDVHSTSSLTAATPARPVAGLVSTSVRCGNHTSTLPSSFAYSTAAEPAAAILSVSPLVAAPGESVTVSGVRFRADDEITFDQTAATILRTRATEHVARVPELPLGITAITVTDPDGRVSTTGPIFTVVEPLPPQIASLAPASVLAGSEIVLEGRGFRPGYTFSIGGVAAPVVTFAYDRVTLRIPSALAAGNHPVHVLNAAGKIAAVGPAVNVRAGALRVVSIAPACGSTEGGTLLVITGMGFAEGAFVTVNGVPATQAAVVSETEIQAIAPMGAAGDAVVRVIDANGDAAAVTGAYRYTSPFAPRGCTQSARARAVRR